MTSRCADPRAALAALLLASLASPAARAGGPSEAPVRYSVALLHFNLQYCAGGLDGFDEALGLDYGDWPTDERSVEDQIIRESFLPILDLLERHPDWALNLEMQGLFVDALRERFPDDLDRLRALAEAGQVELMSFHYSDQLFVAWPRRDIEESIARVRQAFDAADLPLSTVVFAQEGQYTPGMAEVMAEHGYDLLVLPKNLFRYWHPEIEPAPWYRLGGVDVLLGGRGFQAADGQVDLRWTFFDDGELLATGEMNCYLGPAFVAQEEAIAAYEAEVQANADEGFVVGTLSGFRDALAASGWVAPEDLPFTPDGTWQPDDTENVGLWMGGSGLFASTEDDGGVLAGIARARAELLAAEALSRAAGRQAKDAAALAEALTELSLAQVSDATGWNPFVNEVEYSRSHAARVAELAAGVAASALQALGVPAGQEVEVDTGSGSFREVEADEPAAWAPLDGPPPLDVTAVADGRQVEVAWERSSERDTLYRLTVRLSAPAAGEREAEVAFPLATEDLVYSPALADDRIERHPLAGLAGGGDFTLPLANGLIGLAEDVWLVKDARTVHVAARISPAAATVGFADETLPADAGAEWTFLILTGADEQEALALATAVNVTPRVRVVATLEPGETDPPPSGGEGGGCDCRQGGRADAPGAGGIVLVALLGAMGTARLRLRPGRRRGHPALTIAPAGLYNGRSSGRSGIQPGPPRGVPEAPV